MFDKHDETTPLLQAIAPDAELDKKIKRIDQLCELFRIFHHFLCGFYYFRPDNVIDQLVTILNEQNASQSINTLFSDAKQSSPLSNDLHINEIFEIYDHYQIEIDLETFSFYRLLYFLVKEMQQNQFPLEMSLAIIHILRKQRKFLIQQSQLYQGELLDPKTKKYGTFKEVILPTETKAKKIDKRAPSALGIGVSLGIQTGCHLYRISSTPIAADAQEKKATPSRLKLI